MSKSMNIVYLEPGKNAVKKIIGSDYESIQEAVGGGLIKPLYLNNIYGDPVAIICNEEGKYNGMMPCRGVSCDGKLIDYIFGPCFICGLSDKELTSLDEYHLEQYFKMFYYAEQLGIRNEKLIVISYDSNTNDMKEINEYE